VIRSPPTSRRKKKQTASAPASGGVPAASSTPPAAPLTPPERLRRATLILVVALVVARPLLPGDDPGQLGPGASPAGLALNFLWLAAAAAWAGWLVWSGARSWRVGLVEGALLGLGGAFCLGAGFAARYQHPAWLIAWEVLFLALVFALVRHVAADPAERRGLVAAVLATAVSLSAYAVFQRVADVPATQAAADDTTRAALILRNCHDPFLPADAREDNAYLDQLRRGVVTGTFDEASSFAGYLLLMLPVLAGAAVVCWRSGPRWLSGLTTGAAVLAGVAVWLTQAPLDLAQRLPRLGETWAATWRLLTAHPWLGVGPGNFGREVVRSLPLTTGRPDNFLLEAWAGGGLLAVVALVAALALWGRRVARGLRGPDEPEPEMGPHPPWVFYLGGMGGMLLALALRSATLSPDGIVHEGIAAGFRSLCWFGAFFLCQMIPWTRKSLLLSLTAGVVVCLLYLTVAGSLVAPALAQPMWGVAGLAYALAVPEPATATARGPGRLLLAVAPVPVFVILAALFIALVYWPEASAAQELMNARALRYQLTRPPVIRGKTNSDPITNVFTHLGKAKGASPADATAWTDSAGWLGQLPSLVGPVQVHLSSRQAAEDLAEARRLDPLGAEPVRTALDVHLRLAFTEYPPYWITEWAMAREVLPEVVERDPAAEARLNYRMAEAALSMRPQGQPVALVSGSVTGWACIQGQIRVPPPFAGEGYRYARRALELDEEAPAPEYRLTDAQRQAAKDWLAHAPPGN
jgi:O-antigen ligase